MKKLCKHGHERTPDTIYKGGACKICVDLKKLEMSHLKRVGQTREGYLDLLLEQKGLCAICGRKTGISRTRQNSALHQDHNHVTKQLRGLLCGDCNRGIGMFKDNPSFLYAAAMYLAKWTMQLPEPSSHFLR